MKKSKQPHMPMARISVDTRDASKDKFIPREEAVKLYNEGKLWMDVTNSVNEIVYCYPPTKEWFQK